MSKKKLSVAKIETKGEREKDCLKESLRNREGLEPTREKRE